MRQTDSVIKHSEGLDGRSYAHTESVKIARRTEDYKSLEPVLIEEQKNEESFVNDIRELTESDLVTPGEGDEHFAELVT